MAVAAPENPFRITPNPRFVYAGQLDQALAGMRRVVAEGRDGAVLAEPGMGKTLLLRLLGQAHEGAAEVRYVAAGPGFDPAPLFTPAEAALLVMVDDAHALTPRELRRLFEDAKARRETGAVVSVVLAGRPKFEPIAAEAELTLEWFILTGLPVGEVPALVRGRLVSAGRDENAFAEDALLEIAQRSRGVPRLVNLACSNALFRAQTEQVTLEHAQAALDALDLPAPRPESPAPAPEAAPPPSTVIGQAGAAISEPGRRNGRMGLGALASGLGLFIGGLGGLGLLLALAEAEAPAMAVATMAPTIIATPASAAAEPTAEATQTQAEPEPERSPPRVVFHYPAYDRAAARTARRLAESLAENGYEPPAVRPVRARIDSTTVRYFFVDDLVEATRIQQLMTSERGVARASVQDLTHYEPKPSESSIEVWLGGSGVARSAAGDMRQVRATGAPPALKPAAARDWP